MKKTDPKTHQEITDASFFEICRDRFPEKNLFTFQTDDGKVTSITGKSLAEKAIVWGSLLQSTVGAQEKAILLFPQGLEYISALLACFYANVIAVPVAFNESSNKDEVVKKVLSIAKDCRAKCILTDSISQKFLNENAEIQSLSLINVDNIPSQKFPSLPARNCAPQDCAVLLYTSGSTSAPKGVIISHENLKTRAEVSAKQWNIGQTSRILSWLPQYHSFAQDLNIFAPLLKGAHSIIQTPNSFIRQPENWLRAISEFEATISALPNFAIDYCNKVADASSLSGVSLKSLEVILSGGEPVRMQSCERFYEKFQKLELASNVFCPIYGLSEMGTVVTQPLGTPLSLFSLDRTSLENGEVRPTNQKEKTKVIVSTGRIDTKIDIRIVNVETLQECSAREVGEIWIKSAAAGSGYWNRDQETKDTFFGVLKNKPKERYLRTGDLGFVDNDRLYIVGRHKEVMIINGKNYHPSDLEWTVKKSLPSPDLPRAVFSAEKDGQERIFVVQETEDAYGEAELKKFATEIVKAVSATHQVEIYEIIFVRKDSIPKTPTGKIQRKACASLYAKQGLQPIFSFEKGSKSISFSPEPSNENSQIVETIKNEVLGKLLTISAERLQEVQSFNELGIGSIEYIQIAKRLGEVFQIELNPVMLFEYQDFSVLSDYIVSQTTSPGSMPSQIFPSKNFESNEASFHQNDEIAIIGISCHFPGGAENPELFWENLIHQKDCISPVSKRSSIVEDSKKYQTEKDFPPYAGLIEDVDAFDAPFFHVSPLEAESMDPQQRKLLELTWNVIEDGGYNPRQFSDKNIGLFVGVHTNDYAELLFSRPDLMETYGAFLDSGLHASMVANRVSRWLNFHGPSEVINTACSSSLVAVHHAVESISKGECEMAVAGGINLLLAARVFYASDHAGMLAKDGRCKSFDQAANGFVRSEGYGAVLLKPLQQAKKDGDIIYGIIKSTAINHDGQSNSLRAPNLGAQKMLIKTVYRNSGLPLSGIGYLETHGTGTALGDPIEIQALKESFQEMGVSGEEQYCALGTAKTNIGHCESAAGIAGLIKVLLSIRNKTIPGILHFHEMNPYISLEDSPFYIAAKNQEWKRFADAEGNEMPLRAGVSSFGFGGSNAHVILEEYLSKDKAPSSSKNLDAALVVLSAKDEEALQEKAKQLLVWLENNNADLASIAYTLQIAREEMDERLAFRAASVEEIKENLSGFLEGATVSGKVYRGTVSRNKATLGLLEKDEDMAAAVRAWISKKKYEKILDLWVKGFSFDWDQFYENSKPRRISLPGYPFAKKKYWIPPFGITTELKTSRLHPLLHKNMSNFMTQSFYSEFDSEEFFLKDHRVKTGHHTQQPVLPAVAYLEMVRAAVKFSLPEDLQDFGNLVFNDTVWVFPITQLEKKRVIVELREAENDDNRMEYQIFTRDKTNLEATPVLHCQGFAAFTKGQTPEPLNTKELQQELKSTQNAGELYDAFAKMGLYYGPSHRGIQVLYQGEDHILAEIALSSDLKKTQNDYILHPAILDSALQCSIPLLQDINAGSSKPPMPFALDSMEIFSPCTPKMFAWVRYASEGERNNSGAKTDIDLCDENGNICVQMRGFHTRFFEGEIESNLQVTSAPNETALGLHRLVPVWNATAWPKPEKTFEASRPLLLGESKERLQWLQASFPGAKSVSFAKDATMDTIHSLLKEQDFDSLVWIAPDVSFRTETIVTDDIIENQTAGVIQLYRIIKALLLLGYESRDIEWTIITGKTQQVKAEDIIQPVHAGVLGLAGSLAKELPHWNVRVLDVDALSSVSALQCLSVACNTSGDPIALRQEEWFTLGLADFCESNTSPVSYKQNGVYVVIGGAGGVGKAWTKFMMENFRAQVVWIGRKEINGEIEAKIQKLSEAGNPPVYIRADAANLESLQEAHKKIHETYSSIDGVVHSAIVLQDRSIAKMEETVFRAGLSSKVDISVNMHKVFAKDHLDFMLFFSSLMSFSKAGGQANYAAGCTFKDSFALSLSQDSFAVKIVNWGYWGNTGIVSDEFYAKRMEQRGIASIEAQEGMLALQDFIGSDFPQIVLHKTLGQKGLDELPITHSMTRYPSVSTFRLRESERDFIQKIPFPSEGDIPAQAQELSGKILASIFVSLGLFENEILTTANLWKQNRISDFYRQWLDVSVHYLQDQKILDKKFKLRTQVESSEKLWEYWKKEKPTWKTENTAAQLEVLEACLKALPEILKGKRRATDVLFPNSSMELVEGVYKNNAQADYFNEVLKETLRDCIEEQLQFEKNPQIRILEIGAGTGGTTAKLIPMLQKFGGAIQEYCYTDLSKAFLMHAEEQYKPKFEAIRTAIFDVSKPPAGQEIKTGAYDYVIATNVLHATPNIRETLCNAKAVLKNRGVLVFNEISLWSLFTHLTFGLLEGWWLYEDKPLRLTGSPGLNPQSWKNVLREEGFDPVIFPAEKAHRFGQQIVAAQSDGLARRRLEKSDFTKEAEVPLQTETTLVEQKVHKNGKTLRDKAIAYFQELVAQTLKMSASPVKANRPLSEYGLDSILVVQLTNKLRKAFAEITSTLFFEVHSIDELADYFLSNKEAELSALLQEEEPVNTISAAPKETSVHKDISTIFQKSRKKSAVTISKTQNQPAIFDVAIVGISGRYPKAVNLSEFWNNLAEGVNCISEIPKERWSWEDYFDPEKGKTGKIYTKWGGFLDDFDKFDPLFFKISPREAKRMDPQERLFLETCYHVIEDAGYTPYNLGDPEKIGVFAGVMNARYTRQPFHYSIANRVSYLFNFQGPSMAVDTACSSSLTAIHLALESMYTGLSSCAIAGGVNLIEDPVHYVELSEMTMLSASNECKSFGKNADGFIDSEGVGAVLLKPLKQAELDGDHIYGIIKGSAINAGGKTNGYTVPNPKAQSAVVLKALERAQVQADDVSYIEAHGTGTALGDPIEVSGLVNAFRKNSPDQDKTGYCAIGSLKSNIGHCESAAGIAGVTKVILQFQEKKLVPSLHAEVINPEIDFTQTPFAIQRNLEKWNRPIRNNGGGTKEIPRIAGISSFGAGGANAHVILQEYIPSQQLMSQPKERERTNSSFLIPLSARTFDQLKQKARLLLDFLKTQNQSSETDLNELAYTLQTGREEMDFRMGAEVKSVKELIEKLEAYLRNPEDADIFSGHVKSNKETMSMFESDADLQEAVDKWIAEEKFSKLLSLWAKGLDFDWAKMYNEKKPRRISLPLYPFAKDRYWVEPEQNKAAHQTSASILHPLLHKNISNLNHQSYSSVFHGNEWHLVGDDLRQGAKILSPAACLEMARIAIDTASPFQDASSSMQLQNIVWSMPPEISKDREIAITLFAKNKDVVDFEIHGTDEEESVYCQGQGSFVSAPQARVDLEKLRAQMKISKNETKSLPFKMSAFVEMGQSELLAHLKLPDYLENNSSVRNEAFVLHPAFLEGALSLSRELDSSAKQRTAPYYIQSLRVLSSCPKEVYAWLRSSTEDQNGGVAFDLDVIDSIGNVVFQLRNVAYRDDFSEAKEAPEKEIVLSTPAMWQPPQTESLQVSLSSIELDTKADADNQKQERPSVNLSNLN